ncbi:hypothetical protein SCLCIDRAFT_919647 [Scleroderma citrinum Foug A]|uniref:Uncharacterized protein n=1 Tax=Scleroderma citrinum Foug A TaxID=1036808 RepID=A0A0C3DXX0_9AGAM|nr:hypothetical protein SCLCIDRAFT_919647 [Scleroderma citrinum Foug A]
MKVWILDVRLLNTLPARAHIDPASSTAALRPLSPKIEDCRRDKRRRLIDHGREERMRAVLERDGKTTQATSLIYGATAMKRRTRRRGNPVLHSSTRRFIAHSAQLEMRIMANHGADKRFAFLRGRWSPTWNAAKDAARQQYRKKLRSRKRTCKREGHLSRDWLDMGIAMKAGTSLQSRTREMNGPFRHHRFEGLRAAMLRKRGNRLGEKEPGNGLPDAVQSSARVKEKGDHVQVFFICYFVDTLHPGVIYTFSIGSV